MSALTPYPFDRLITRMLRELDHKNSIFDLPLAKCFLGSPAHNLSVNFHGKRASTPLGPAAGPHSQLAQNIVLAWLGGSRIIELKTVQILDQLEIPRPCIDMRTVGYNVEWSQELRLEQSLDEYVKASMLIEILCASGTLDLAPGFTNTIFDMSVGYDLDGIQSPAVRRFIEGMMDATPIVDRLRTQIPDDFASYRNLPFQTNLSNTLTLSTFHGCPPNEIERIIRFLQDEYALNCIVKLNPTLLGPDAVRSLLNDQLGYTDIRIPDSAFKNDTQWEQAVAFVDRLGARAQKLGVGFGVKFTNTLIVEHDGDFIPSTEKQKYLSGQPLHVLAMHLVARFRERFENRYPISFSAGIDRANFADAVGLGLTPVTVCSDLLRVGGYARLQTYFAHLLKRMDAVGATSINEFILKTHGKSDADLNGSILDNTQRYVEQVTCDSRYTMECNSKTPRKIGSTLELFNCLTCDKCIPVCPNDANFRLQLPPRTIPIQHARCRRGSWTLDDAGELELTKKHQIANFDDFCNECGNCDVFCPEHGGPYILKPRFFGSRAAFENAPGYDGFYLEQRGHEQCVFARIGALACAMTRDGNRVTFTGTGFAVTFNPADLAATITGSARGPVDLTYYHIMDLVREAIFETADINYANIM